MKISVCMATYNGSNYIVAQLNSILSQLGEEDEIIIVDDASFDTTKQIIAQYRDPRIKLYYNEANRGVVSTFEKALALSTGDLMILSDQDDVWFDNKIAEIKKIFSSNVDLVVHDAVIVKNGQVVDNSLFRLRGSSSGIIKNIISNTYVGCCMAFRRNVLDGILPIPTRRGILHDAWIGILAEFYSYKIFFLHIPLIKFIRHHDNATTLIRRNLFIVFYERVIFIYEFTLRIIMNLFRK